MYRITLMDEKEAAFYKKVIKYLIQDINFNPTSKVIRLNSGDNLVMVRGEFAGYSTRELKEYIARVENKSIEYEPEEY